MSVAWYSGCQLAEKALETRIIFKKTLLVHDTGIRLCGVRTGERERGWSCNQATEMLMEHHTDTEKTKYHLTFRF